MARKNVLEILDFLINIGLKQGNEFYIHLCTFFTQKKYTDIDNKIITT